jgi:hypothetical protein
MGEADLEQVVDESMAALPADIAENFLSALGSVGRAASPLVQRLGPGVARGAASGATVGGPWGALIGAGAGLGSGLLGGNASSRAPASAARTASPSSAPAVPLALPTGQAAAGTLLGLLQNPAIHQALLSQVLGASGAQQIATPSGATVPRAAINGLLTQLLANATEDLPESEDVTEQSYLQGMDGEFLVDPASLDQQAALVLSKLIRPFAGRAPSEDLAIADFGGDAVEFY